MGHFSSGRSRKRSGKSSRCRLFRIAALSLAPDNTSVLLWLRSVCHRHGQPWLGVSPTQARRAGSWPSGSSSSLCRRMHCYPQRWLSGVLCSQGGSHCSGPLHRRGCWHVSRTTARPACWTRPAATAWALVRRATVCTERAEPREGAGGGGPGTRVKGLRLSVLESLGQQKGITSPTIWPPVSAGKSGGFWSFQEGSAV